MEISPATSPDYEAQLQTLVRADAWLMGLLRAVRSLGLAQWCIAAGAVRNLVWDHLHGYAQRTLPSDIDVLFYDATRVEPGYEAELEARLNAILPAVRWEAANQATIHTYNQDAPYESIEAAMARWADLVTAVGVRLTEADEIEVLAPAKLDDLFELRVRPNLLTVNSEAVYRQRMREKNWPARWPRLSIEWPEGRGDAPDSRE